MSQGTKNWTDEREHADIELEKRSLSDDEVSRYRDRRGLEAESAESEPERDQRRYGG